MLVAVGLFGFLGAGPSEAEPIERHSRGDGFADVNDRYIPESWEPSPHLAELADVSIDALHQISVGATPTEALDKAIETRSLSMWGDNPFLDQEAVQNCEWTYFAVFDTFVNACDPFEGAFQETGTIGPAVLPPTWQRVMMLSGSWVPNTPGLLGTFVEFPNHPGWGIYCDCDEQPGGPGSFTGTLGYDTEANSFELRMDITGPGAPSTFELAGTFGHTANSCNDGSCYFGVAQGTDHAFAVSTDFEDDLSLGYAETGPGTAYWQVVQDN